MEPDEDTLMMDMQLRAVATASPMEMQASLASAFSVLGNSVIHPDLHLHDAKRTKTVATAWRCVKLTSKGWRRRTDTHLPRPLHAHLHHAPSYYNHIYWRQRHWLKSERCEEQPARDGRMKIGGCSDPWSAAELDTSTAPGIAKSAFHLHPRYLKLPNTTHPKGRIA